LLQGSARMLAGNAAVNGALREVVSLVQTCGFPEMSAGTLVNIRALAVLKGHFQRVVLEGV
jgi:hypothetical protein